MILSEFILYALSFLAIIMCLISWGLGVKVLYIYQGRINHSNTSKVISWGNFKNNYFVRQSWIICILNTISLIFVFLVLKDMTHIPDMIGTLGYNSFLWWKVFDALLALGYCLVYLDKLYDKRHR